MVYPLYLERVQLLALRYGPALFVLISFTSLRCLVLDDRPFPILNHVHVVLTPEASLANLLLGQFSLLHR